jgi:3-isopropylmalate/(R)-2-methylmalate dehydratase small subunit
MMEKFTTISSSVVPLARRDVDTDMIIPAQFLTSIANNGFADALFRRLRDQEADFPLRDPRYRESKVLIAQSNFGCGSSREHAVWALRDWGFRVIIAESFADIFAGNSAKNGLLLVTLPAAEIEALLNRAQQDQATVTVDLGNQTVTLTDGRSLPFTYDPFRRHCLLNGLDDLDYILSHQKELDQFHEIDIKRLFFV